MKWQKLTLLILLCCGGLYAQWGYDTTNPNVIESTLLGSYSPQTCIAEDGSAYFGWIEYSAGQRNCYLQKIDSYGSNIWTAPVMIFSTGSDISTNDWNMVLDHNGYPIVVVSKCLTGSKNVSAYKVSPAGSLLWGNDGIALSADTLSAYTNLQPAVVVTTQNQIVVAWQHTDTAVTIRCQALSPEGNLLWGADGITENIENNLLSAPQLIPSDYGSVLLKYHADSGMISLPIIHIWVTKLLADGSAGWVNPLEVQNLGGISANLIRLPIISDGQGGMVIAWSDWRNDADDPQCYAQRITAGGNFVYLTNGVSLGAAGAINQSNPRLYFNQQTQELFAAWDVHPHATWGWAIYLQKLDVNGMHQFPDAGIICLQPSNFETTCIGIDKLGEGYAITYVIRSEEGISETQYIKALYLDANGQTLWANTPLAIATNLTFKNHAQADFFAQQWGIITWADVDNVSQIRAMRFNPDGTLGNGYLPPAGLDYVLIDPNDIVLSWTMPQTLTPPAGYKIYRNNQLLHQVTGFANQTYQVENCPAGQWEFRVQAIWQNGLGSPLSPVVYVSIFVPDAEYLIYQYVSSTAVQFSWHFPISALMPAGYNLYRNGQLWQYIPGSMTFGYLWQGVEAGVWTFYLRAVWVDGYESAPTDEVSITITGAEDATQIMPTSSVIACPNPFRTQVDFLLQEKHTAADKQIKIYNVRGQCIRYLAIMPDAQGRLSWDGRDEKYQEVGSGLYFAVYGDRKDRKILKLMKY